MKRTIRLTESDLHNMVNEAVRKMLNEENGVYGFNDELVSIYNTLKDIVENILNGPAGEDFDVAYGNNVCSAMFHIKKAYELLSGDSNVRAITGVYD